MAEEAKVSKVAIARKNFSKFYRETKSELKKVIWPNRAQLTNNTITVLASCLVVGALLWIVDAGLNVVVERVFAR